MSSFARSSRKPESRFPARMSLTVLALLSSAVCEAQSMPHITAVTKKARDASPGRYPAEMVPSGQPNFNGEFLEGTAFRTADGKASVRLWESGPGVLVTKGYPYDEYCLVLSGRLEITELDGTRASYGPGDTFVIPKGWQGKWNMRTRFRKQYIALTQPDAAAVANP